MNAAIDTSAPSVRVVALPDPKAPEGTPVPLQDRVVSFTFEDSDKKADKAKLTLRNDDLSLFEHPALLAGTILEVSWGFLGNMSAPRRLVVSKYSGFESLTVECRALSVLMHKVAKTRCWENKTRCEVVEQVARENGFEGIAAAIEQTDERLDCINQTGETDARFLKRLAAEEGFDFFIDDGGLHWHERRQDIRPTHVFDYRGGAGRGDILSISVESDLTRRVGKVTVKGRDPKNKTNIKEEADDKTVHRTALAYTTEVVNPDTLDEVTAHVVDYQDEMLGQSIQGELVGYEDPVAEKTVLAARNAVALEAVATAAKEEAAAKRLAAAKFKKAERAAVKLSVQLLGDPTLRAKTIVEMEGLPPSLAGKYYVCEVTHTISSSGYVCDAKMTRDGKGKLAAKLWAELQAKQNRHRVKFSKEPYIVKEVDPDTLDQYEVYYHYVNVENHDPYVYQSEQARRYGRTDPAGRRSVMEPEPGES